MARRRSLGKKRKSYSKTRNKKNKKNKKTVRKTRRMRGGGGISYLSRFFKPEPTDAWGRTQKEAEKERENEKLKDEKRRRTGEEYNPRFVHSIEKDFADGVKYRPNYIK